MTRLYLDACTIIYLLEGEATVRSKAGSRVTSVERTAGARLLTSRLAMLECRVKPLRDGNANLLRQYAEFFGRPPIEIVEVGATVIESATRLRARYGFKTPDAIHLASAIEARADTFLTADTALSKCKDVNVEIL